VCSVLTGSPALLGDLGWISFISLICKRGEGNGSVDQNDQKQNKKKNSLMK
jgi:hypothetical protein